MLCDVPVAMKCADIKECNFPELNNCDTANAVGDIEALCDEEEGFIDIACRSHKRETNKFHFHFHGSWTIVISSKLLCTVKTICISWSGQG